MKYLIMAAVIVLFVAIRAVSFAIWQFKNKNIIGGIMVTLVAVTATVSIILQL